MCGQRRGGRELAALPFRIQCTAVPYRPEISYTLPLSGQRRLIIPFKVEVKSCSHLIPDTAFNREKLLDPVYSTMSEMNSIYMADN